MRHSNPRTIITASIVLILTVIVKPCLRAQTFTVLHTFTGGQDGANPTARLTMDRAGNLYGTASNGGSGFGSVYKLHFENGWLFIPLYSFQGGSDGANPAAVVIGPNGSLYGPTVGGGGCDNGGSGCGTVFNLRPPPHVSPSIFSPWTETVLYRFGTMGNSGTYPGFAEALAFDQAGNIYGTTTEGGQYGGGTVFKLTPLDGGWTYSVLWGFGSYNDDPGEFPFYHYSPQSGVILDSSGGLYGTTEYGDDMDDDCIAEHRCGSVYRVGTGGGETTLVGHLSFANEFPFGGLIFDQFGNLYGATNSGVVFEIPYPPSGYFNSLYTLGFGEPFTGPCDSLMMDAAGNLYGTTVRDGAYGLGSVFELTPSNGGWTYTSLHDFYGGVDGYNPYGGLVMDANGNLYGTTFYGGAQGVGCQENTGCGVVFEITR